MSPRAPGRARSRGRRAGCAAAALAVAASLAAGCGGDDGAAKAGYVAAADRICAKASTAAAPLVDRVTAGGVSSLTPRRARSLAGVMGRLYALGVRYRDDLNALEVPAGDEQDVQAFLDPTGEIVDAIGKGRDALASGNALRALALLARAQTVDQQAAAAARDYGYKQCGSVIASP